MKKIIFLIAILFATMYSYSQDRIIKKDKSEIKAKVLEVGDVEIKYKKEDNPDGPTYAIKKAEVNVIIYKNGQVESFNDIVNTHAPAQPTNTSPSLGNNNGSNPNKSGIVRIEKEKANVFTFYDANNKKLNSKQSYKKLLPYIKDDTEIMQAFKEVKTANTVNQVYNGVTFVVCVVNLVQLIRKPRVLGDPIISTGQIIMLGLVLGDFVGIMPYVKSKYKGLASTFNQKKSNSTSLKFGLTNNGVGLALNF
jgi:hypothetical protein